MSTTAVVAEILIVGLETETCLLLLVLGLSGTGWIDLGAVSDWQALDTVLVLASAYMLGVFADRAADSLLRLVPGEQKKLGRMRLQVIHASEPIGRFLEYQRSRLRVARGTVLNSVLLIPCLTVFLACRTDTSTAWLASIDAGGVLLAVALFVVMRMIQEAYENRLDDARSILLGP